MALLFRNARHARIRRLADAMIDPGARDDPLRSALLASTYGPRPTAAPEPS